MVGPTRPRLRMSIGVAALATVATLALSGCVMQPEAEPTTKPSSTSSTPTPTVAPTLDPAGTAESNLPYFDWVNQQTLAGNAEADGRAFVDGLVAAGFDKAAMEVTLDATPKGYEPDSIQFSVRWGDQCLIGQNGGAVGGYHSTLAPVLGTGTCLVGQTRPIDW